MTAAVGDKQAAAFVMDDGLPRKKAKEDSRELTKANAALRKAEQELKELKDMVATQAAELKVFRAAATFSENKRKVKICHDCQEGFPASRKGADVSDAMHHPVHGLVGAVQFHAEGDTIKCEQLLLRLLKELGKR